MRHFLSLLLGLFLAPLMWALTAWSTYRFFVATANAQPLDEAGGKLIVPILLLLAAGAFIGLLLGTDISPLGPGMAGVVFLVIASLFVFLPEAMGDFVSNFPGKNDTVLTVPVAMGSAFMLGAALLVPLFSPARWQGRPETDDGPPVRIPAPRNGSRPVSDDVSTELFGDAQRALPPGRVPSRDDLIDPTGEYRAVRDGRVTSGTAEQRLSNRAERRAFNDGGTGTGTQPRYAEPTETRSTPSTRRAAAEAQQRERAAAEQRRGPATGQFPVFSGEPDRGGPYRRPAETGPTGPSGRHGRGVDDPFADDSSWSSGRH